MHAFSVTLLLELWEGAKNNFVFVLDYKHCGEPLDEGRFAYWPRTSKPQEWLTSFVFQDMRSGIVFTDSSSFTATEYLSVGEGINCSFPVANFEASS